MGKHWLATHSVAAAQLPRKKPSQVLVIAKSFPLDVSNTNSCAQSTPEPKTTVSLTFERPVRGPIALGYGAHFGLGVFAAVSEPAR
jgi:CRISPR-associated protein Csb2